MAIEHLSIDPRTILPVLGNPEVVDWVGLGVALMTVLALLPPGKNATTVQFDTIRKTQTWYANAYDAGVVGRLDMYRTKVHLYRTMVLLARPTKVRP
jgi:hypothetical protein